MLGRLAPALLVLLPSCRATAREVPPVSAAPPAVAAPLVTPLTDLSGGWATGTGDPPQVPKIVLHPTCTVVPAVWLIEQKGNALRAWAFPERYNQGIATKSAAARIAPAMGTISGAEVVLDDGTDRYLLRYDTSTSHLAGTRNGTSFWAVRQLVVREGTCLPPPA